MTNYPSPAQLSPADGHCVRLGEALKSAPKDISTSWATRAGHMGHIFISYQREDRQVAEGLAQWFAQRGWSVWWDRQLLGGEAYTQVIAQQLDTAHAVVVLWSKGSVRSNWVIDEASRAQNRLVPVLIENVRPPLGYGSLHTFDLSSWRGSPSDPEFIGLMRTLETRLATGFTARAATSISAAPVNVPARSRQTPTRPLFAVGGVVGILVLVVAGALIAAASGNKSALSASAAPLEAESKPGPAGPAAFAAPATTPAAAETADILGAWDSSKANELVAAKMTPAPWAKLLSTQDVNAVCRPKHSSVGEYSLLYPTSESRLVVMSSICEGADCHACSPDLSLFQFDKVDAGWNLVHSDLAAIPWGQWGDGTAAPSVRVIGNNRFGLVLEGGGTGQGIVDTSVNIWARISDSYRPILTLTTGEDTGGNPDLPRSSWQAKLEVQDRGATGFFNIRVTRKGVEEGKPLDKTELWVFDGQKYAPAGEYQ